MVTSLVQENDNSYSLSSKNDVSSVSMEELKNSARKALNNEHTPAISSLSPRPDGSEFKVLCHSIDVKDTTAPDLVFTIIENTKSVDNQGLSISVKDLKNPDLADLEIFAVDSKGEVVKFFPDSDIYSQIGLNKGELAQFALARFEAISNNTVEQQIEQFKQQYPIDSVVTQTAELKQEVDVAVSNNSNTWIESLKSQLDNIDASKLQVFSGSTRAYERIDNIVTIDNLETPLGQKVQQALENPAELKGLVKVLADGEKVYDARDGEVSENRYSLTLDNPQVAQKRSLDIIPEVAQVVEALGQNPQVIPLPERGQSNSTEQVNTDFIPPQEIVVTVTNEQIKSPPQGAQPTSFEANEKAIFELIARQDARINQLEQKLAASSQPLNVKVNQWLGAVNQTAKEAVQQVKQKSLHIPPFVRSFIANKANEIQNTIKEQVNATRTHIVNKVNESVTGVKSEVIGKVNEVKSSLERQLADVAGASLNASTRYLAERFGVDNGAGIKVFQGNSLVITSSVEHSGIYSLDGKQLVKDGQFISPVTREQLSKIAQVPTEAQKLSQSSSTVRAKALR